MAQLVVPSFGGGVSLVGSSDAKRTDELLACNSFDIGERGHLIAASDVSNPDTFNGITPAYGVGLRGSTDSAQGALVVGEFLPVNFYAVYDTGRSPNLAGAVRIFTGATLAATGHALNVVSFPYVSTTAAQSNPTFINLGARQMVFPNAGSGLYADNGTNVLPISTFDALGTGATATSSSSFAGGTNAKQLYFRGIAAYNNHLFGFGFDQSDATNREGRNRLMFSNTGNPYKWGNDNLASGVDRAFSDTDAVNVGGAGDRITCAYPWGGKLYVATDRELHWIAGYGRESFITDGPSGAVRENVTSVNGMCEGPDGLLYGVGTRGLWVYDGSSMDGIGRRLVDFGGKSNGWWDLIWTDTTRAAGYPGVTNADLVWLMSDRLNKQVWVGIPYCSATNGYGYGTDTVIIKYHTETGGFSRQVLSGVPYTGGVVLPQNPYGQETIVLARGDFGSGAASTRYRYKSSTNASPAMPTALPSATFGPYAPFGPHGTGVNRIAYVTLAWESASSLPIVFTLTPTVDDQTLGAVKVSIQSSAPGSPSDGDLWLDTSGTDTNLGNATAGVTIPAAADYLLKVYSSARLAWRTLPRGGMKGNRATLRIAYTPARGTRVSLALATTSAAGRFQIESIGLEPSGTREAA